MATKIQLEAMVNKVMELQYYGETIFSIMFDPCFLIINTASTKKIFIDTDGKEMEQK